MLFETVSPREEREIRRNLACEKGQFRNVELIGLKDRFRSIASIDGMGLRAEVCGRVADFELHIAALEAEHDGSHALDDVPFVEIADDAGNGYRLI